MINLISDTVTKPTAAMLAAMFAAEVGDDVFREDPTVNALEEKTAALFGMEAALFCPSGTMSNQLAIKVLTQPTDEIICDETSHIYNYEGAGYAFHSGVSVYPIRANGILTVEQIEQAIKPTQDWLPRSSLVVLENTGNRSGGNYYYLSQIELISNFCKQRQLALHLDGARIFNALVATGERAEEYGKFFDSISVCLSKGLGAPIGSMLVGGKDFIRAARRFRKIFGGGMRQAGYLAAAGIYALDNHILRLKDDHLAAQQIGNVIQELKFVEYLLPVKTNIIIFNVKFPHSANYIVEQLMNQNIKVSAFGGQSVRMVTHLDITPSMVQTVISALKNIDEALT
ncbi:MAG: aminotransferase class V-fold PLP-dependent enzyme [Saprospiraceae bacterium]|nr:aminotransferase class V-fold PLP-dependent enzyme [Saprospiraceae bacterium]MBP7699170.1 aminotransferase class V-fold PLP-dependent enzyme [Saprospiraceae bacterium]